LGFSGIHLIRAGFVDFSSTISKVHSASFANEAHVGEQYFKFRNLNAAHERATHGCNKQMI